MLGMGSSLRLQAYMIACKAVEAAQLRKASTDMLQVLFVTCRYAGRAQAIFENAAVPHSKTSEPLPISVLRKAEAGTAWPGYLASTWACQ